MRKSTLFISAILTTFMLAVLFGVVAQYKNNLSSAQTATQTTVPAAEVLPADTATAAPTQAPILTPQEAASTAAQVLGKTDLLSVETSLFNGVSAYLVKFISGDQVYVSPQGMILSVVLAPTPAPMVIVQSSKNGGKSGGNNRSGGGEKGGGEGGGGGDD